MDFSFNIILLFVFHIFAAVAVSKDCTARGIKKKDAYAISAFFLPIIVGIIYACKRNKSEKSDEIPENSAALKSRAKLLSVIAVITLVASGVAGTMAMNNSDPMFTYHYDIIQYDRNGDPYFFNRKMNYYDSEDNVYQINDEKNALVNIETQEYYEYPICFIDKDGYVVFLDDDARLRGESDGYIYNVDEHSYIYLPYAKWDREGMLYDSNGTHWVLH